MPRLDLQFQSFGASCDSRLGWPFGADLGLGNPERQCLVESALGPNLSTILVLLGFLWVIWDDFLHVET
jgi:hypothetical protein